MSITHQHLFNQMLIPIELTHADTVTLKLFRPIFHFVSDYANTVLLTVWIYLYRYIQYINTCRKICIFDLELNCAF